jgi:hypothetical protein
MGKSVALRASANVRFAANSDRLLRRREMTLCANPTKVRRSKIRLFDHLVSRS